MLSAFLKTSGGFHEGASEVFSMRTLKNESLKKWERFNEANILSTGFPSTLD